MRNNGFTLVETILTVAVLASIMAIAAPTLGQFIGRHQHTTEIEEQRRIYSAMQRFAELYNQYPEDTFPPAANTNPMCSSPEWYSCLSDVSDMGPSQIQFDIWDQPRAYVTAQVDKEILGTTLNVHYASIHSKGLNREADETDGIAVSGSEFANASNSNWWANQTNVNTRLSEFEGLTAGEDDVLIKMTDQILKIEKYRTTQDRLAAIKNALITIEQTSYIETFQSNPALTDQVIHVPPSLQTTQANALNGFSAVIRTAMAPYSFVGGRIRNRDTNVTHAQNRRTDMINLMRFLGLPDEFCCSALVKDPDANPSIDYQQGRPFFYYSNPRLRIGGVCATRAGQPPFAPARVSQNPYVCG